MSSNKEGQYKIIRSNPMRVLKSEYYEKMKWCLTEKAAFALNDMINTGLDPDLALFMLEEKWTEADIYDPNAIKEEDK